MKRHVKTAVDWLRDAGSWTVVLAATALGVIVSNLSLPGSSQRGLKAAQVSTGIVIAVLLVGREERRGSGPGKAAQLPFRMVHGFTNGIAWRTVDEVGFPAVQRVIESLFAGG